MIESTRTWHLSLCRHQTGVSGQGSGMIARAASFLPLHEHDKISPAALEIRVHELDGRTPAAFMKPVNIHLAYKRGVVAVPKDFGENGAFHLFERVDDDRVAPLTEGHGGRVMVPAQKFEQGHVKCGGIRHLR
eukprot:CAMPEP_0172614876 /NCGR_PEP_ID=MMETSP1068-20121228/55683_1 /TAXON_ID=35684 /ORGANISM="Pseudopedinella elastica, Strain CCMP716" /LENGTH=132 /DNA_ID=CAMNT_0013419827 /DNA_START=192 /DNA_END=586 /DNA_ORIENTATION=-